MRLDLFNSVRQARRYRVYRRMLVSFVLLVVTAVFLASLLLTVLYANNAFREAEERTRAQLRQTDYSISVLYEQAEAVSYALNESSALIRFFAQTGEDKLVKYQAQLEIAKYKGIYGSMFNISVVNAVAGCQADCINTVDNLAFFRENGGQARAVARTVYPYLGAQKPKGVKVITLIFPSVNGAGGVLIDLDAALFAGYLQSYEAGADATMLLCDEAGRVALSSGAKVDFSAGTEGDGLWYARVDGRFRQVARLEIDCLGWRLYRIEPLGSMLASYGALFRSTLFVSALAAAVGMALALGLAKAAYDPFARLVERTLRPRRGEGEPLDEYAALDTAFSAMRREGEEARRALREMCVARLLAADGPDMEPARVLALKEGQTYLVLAFADRNAAHGNAEARGFAIAEAARALLPDAAPCEAAQSGELALALLTLKDGQAPGRLPLVLDEMGEGLRARYGIRLLTAVDCYAHSPEEVPEAAARARSLLLYSYYLEGSVLSPADLPAPGGEPDVEELRRLLTAAVGGEGELSALYEAASRLEPARNRALLAQCLREVCARSGVEAEPFVGRVEAAEVYAQTKEAVGECVRLLAENEGNRLARRNRQLAERVRAGIEAHYADPDFTLQSAAAEIGLSPGYVGRIFKSVTGETFGDALTGARMAEAKRLLLKSDLSVAEIAERVGLSNAAYFATLFRKSYDMSPSAMRESAAR